MNAGEMLVIAYEQLYQSTRGVHTCPEAGEV